MDLKQALLDPASLFKSPNAVVESKDLSHEQKIQVLRRWEYDARELQVAEEENMIGGGQSDLLRQILLALDALGVDHTDGSPTKQG
ncbi:MAG: hypothetical protein HWD59_05260 [Coxiellaceae bacterium]|nr:MAG: hypothetical protein HWD59_05260 [Coxiellaceae bacterium]